MRIEAKLEADVKEVKVEVKEVKVVLDKLVFLISSIFLVGGSFGFFMVATGTKLA